MIFSLSDHLPAQCAVGLHQRRHAALRADVVAEHRRGLEIALLLGIQRHRDALHVVRGGHAPEILQLGVVERRLAGVGEHRDLGRVDQRGGRVRLIRARAQHAEQVRRSRQHLRRAGDRVGRVAARVHALAGHLVGQHAACRVDRGRRGQAARHHLRPEWPIRPGERVERRDRESRVLHGSGAAADEHAAVAETARTAAAATSARARVRRDLREGMCGCSHSVLIYVKVLPQMRPAVVYMNALWQTRIRGPLARLTG